MTIAVLRVVVCDRVQLRAALEEMSDVDGVTPPPPSLSGLESPPSPSGLESPPSYESLGPPVPAVPAGAQQSHLHQQSLDSINSVGTPTRQEQIHVGGIPDASPPPPYSPRRWSIAFSRASSSLQRNVVARHVQSPEATTLYERIRKLHRESSNGTSFLWNFGQILLSTVACLIILIVFLVVPLAILVIGIVYFNGCPAEPLIPIFLTTGSLALFVKIFLLMIEGTVLRNCTAISTRLAPCKQVMITCCCMVGHIIFNIFLVGWIVAGGYWVFSKYNEVVELGYFTCNEVLYKFSFSIITLCGITMLFWSVCMCVGCLCVSVSLHKKRSQHTSGEVVCSSDWVINGGGPSGAQETQVIRIQEIGTDEDEESDVSYSEMHGNTSNDGSEASAQRNGGVLVRQVPVEVTPERGLISVTEEEEEEEEEDHTSVNSSTLSPALHLDSQELDTASSRLGSATFSPRASYGRHSPEIASSATSQASTSYLSHSLQRQPNSFSGPYFNPGMQRQPQSSLSHLDSVPCLPSKRHSSNHSSTALKNTTSSYVNLAPIPSVRYALTVSECVRSNPQLYRSPQRPLQHQRDASKTHSMESHSSGRRPRYPSVGYASDRSRTSLRDSSLDGSTLYMTVQSQGHSTTFV